MAWGGAGGRLCGNPFLSSAREPGIALGNSLCLEKCRAHPLLAEKPSGFSSLSRAGPWLGWAAGPPAHASVSTPWTVPGAFPHVCCGRSFPTQP